MAENAIESLNTEIIVATQDMTQDERSKLAFELEQHLRDIKMRTGMNFIEMGKTLKEIRDNKLYKELGYDTVTEWLSDPDISISASWAWNFISIYEILILKHGIMPEKLLEADYNKLIQIIPIVRKNPESAEVWVEKAKTLRKIDLQREIKAKVIQDKEENPTFTPEFATSEIITGDRIEELKKMPDKSVDAVITQPVLFIRAEDTDRIERQNPNMLDRVQIVKTYDEVLDFHSLWLMEAIRILKDNGSLFIFGTYRSLVALSHILSLTECRIVRDIIVAQRQPNQVVGLERLVNSHTTVLWVKKGATHTCNLTDVTGDIWSIPEKGTDYLIEQVVKMGTDVGNLVLDPFADNSQILSVTKMFNRNVVGIKNHPPV